MKVRCKNCRLEFKTDDNSRVSRCSRCDSDKLEFTRDPLPETIPAATPAGTAKPGTESSPKVYSTSGAMVYGDTKDAWKSYHSNPGGGASGCPHCGGSAFEFNYKRKEKICKKCGEILPLPRRMA